MRLELPLLFKVKGVSCLFRRDGDAAAQQNNTRAHGQGVCGVDKSLSRGWRKMLSDSHDNARKEKKTPTKPFTQFQIRLANTHNPQFFLQYKSKQKPTGMSYM